jgi:ribosomal protein S18 acetylase RimI-like enzyme
MNIKSLSKTNFDTIFKAFNEAFADYEIQLNREQLQTMLKRRGFNPDLSFAAFENDKIVSFTLNGIGNFNGIPTAYDTGTGTLKEHRGKGLATQIFEYSIPFLREANIGQYLLEVLQHNTKAISVYQNLGFETTREFNCFKQKNEEVNLEIKTTDMHCTIQRIDIESFNNLSDFWDFHPSWQNSFESIQRASGDFVSLGAFSDNKLVGYAVFEPVSGDVTQIAVEQEHRRKGIGTLLLNEIVKLNKFDSVKVLNTDILHHAITDFLKAKNVGIMVKQFEMIKQLK